TFLANMDDITGAYYDEDLNRIVFIGKTNTSLPEFDKDDLAVAIKSVIFSETVPAFSLEQHPTNPNLQEAVYFGAIENTRFGQVLFDADYTLKKYLFGYDENQQPIASSVSGYKSLIQRWIDNGPDTNYPVNS